jgi:hypothetical protein
VWSTENSDDLECTRFPTHCPTFPTTFPNNIMASTPYPFTASSSSHGSNSRPPVQYPRLQQQQQQRQPATSPPATMASRPQQQRPFYAQSPSNSPSTQSLLPPSARGPPAVQAAFAQGPRPALRNIASNSSIVRSYGLIGEDIFYWRLTMVFI